MRKYYIGRAVYHYKVLWGNWLVQKCYIGRAVLSLSLRSAIYIVGTGCKNAKLERNNT